MCSAYTAQPIRNTPSTPLNMFTLHNIQYCPHALSSMLIYSLYMHFT